MTKQHRGLIGLSTLAVLLAIATPAGAQRIVVNEQQPVLAGTPIRLQLSELKPGQTVILQAERAVRMFTGQTARFEGSARFQADAQGRVDLASQAPLPGSSYSGADVHGLLWSMKQQPGSVEQPVFNRIGLRLQDADGKTLAEAELKLQQQLATVQTRKAEGFPGALLAAPAGAVKGPTLILLGGSEGGSLITRDAAHWASFGYTVLALPYYSPARWSANGPLPAELPELPEAFSMIPVDRLQAARDWLAEQPEADVRRLGLMGTSKGAEFALLAAVRFPWIKAVAAVVPSDVVWEGWSGIGVTNMPSFAWKGEPYAFIRYKEFAEEFQGFQTGKDVHIRRPQDKGRAASTTEQIAAARIPVESIKAPVWLLGGGDDQIWASGEMAANIKRSRDAAGLTTVALVYPEAGHFLGGTGTGPTTHYNDGPSKNGGTPAANARAQAEGHASLLRFFGEHLK